MIAICNIHCKYFVTYPFLTLLDDLSMDAHTQTQTQTRFGCYPGFRELCEVMNVNVGMKSKIWMKNVLISQRGNN